MNDILPTRTTSANPIPRPSPGARRCSCPGCESHVRRLEALNAQLARDNDRLRDQVGRLLRSGGAEGRAAS